ncbi:MAG: hypothetical protein WD273_02425 [Trueperaceae bacterium]
MSSCSQQLGDPRLPINPGEPPLPVEPDDPDAPDAPGAGRVETAATNLLLLPENPRYFEYKGLPLVSFGHQGGLSPVPTGTFSADVIVQAARYGNSLYTAAHPQWVNASYDELLETLQDDAHWEHLEELARTASENDVILRVYFWSYKWNYDDESYSATDMLWPDPGDDGGEVTGGWTRRELHELTIERVVEATWQYPNVVYNFMWEYNTKRSLDPDGAFHQWWVEQLHEAGREIDPETTHLVSIEEGRPLPGDETADFESEQSPDFIVEEDGNGFWYSCETDREKLLSYNVPLVFIASDYPFADNDFSGWDDVPSCGREWNNDSVSDYAIRPEDVRDMLMGGFHPAEAWAPARADTLDYYLQARWYMENVGVLDTSLTGTSPTGTFPIGTSPTGTLANVPRYRPSQRPQLINPEGLTNGRGGDQYAAIYRHPQGLPPAQAEVWIDVNSDGRFSPDPADGERFEMEAQGDDFANGVTFTAQGPADARYLFRFADQNWNPPETGGLVPGVVEGISYGHWGG